MMNGIEPFIIFWTVSLSPRGLFRLNLLNLHRKWNRWSAGLISLLDVTLDVTLIPNHFVAKCKLCPYYSQPVANWQRGWVTLRQRNNR